MLWPTLFCLLFFLGLHGNCTGFAQENCTNYPHLFDTVYSVSGDVAMLDSDLLSPYVFDFKSVPYNITWYDSKTGREINNQTHKILVIQETLWFLRISREDEGEYVVILRTPSKCYTQNLTLKVDDPVDGKCESPNKACQTIYRNLSGNLACPMSTYAKKLKSYNITSSIKWYKDCLPIEDGTGGYLLNAGFELIIAKVGPEHNTSYTCTLMFSLGGINGSVSETINALVKEEYYMAPQVIRPLNETFRALIGSSFSKQCLAFVPGVGDIWAGVNWRVNGSLIKTSERIYETEESSWVQTVPVKRKFFQIELIFSEVKEEDFYHDYICQLSSDKGSQQTYFTLLPPEPNIKLSIGLVLGGVTAVVFLSTVIVFYCFKIDIMLCFRKVFPVSYRNKDLDGKLYDAYVAYPLSCDPGFSEEVEKFALHALPQVLENVCGYKLFIAGRDCLPGEATVDSVEENLQASRRVLLLYTASTFNGKRQTRSGESWAKMEIKTTNDSIRMNYEGETVVCSNPRQQLELVAAMHRALLEESLKVILVELEEISPAQLVHFPESVRQLRKKQGAVCWWKKSRWTCTGTGKDEEKGGQDQRLSPSLAPSSRFWKEIRYHMPVRRKKSQTQGRLPY